MRFTTTQGSSDRSMLLLAPAGACLRPFSGATRTSTEQHEHLLTEMQRLRGRIYLNDGAIRPSQLSECGRHISSLDEASWHLLTMVGSSVQGCIRFLQHPNTVRSNQLNVSGAPLARSNEWAAGFFSSINSELEAARRENFSYVEIGGWALAPELRGSVEALSAVLSTYALAQVQGGALGVTTATMRNGSATILRKLGGRSLEWNGSELPPYYDETYRCGMEMLRFDSRIPCSRYSAMVAALQEKVSRLTVIYPDPTPVRQPSPGLFSELVQVFFPSRSRMPVPLAA